MYRLALVAASLCLAACAPRSRGGAPVATTTAATSTASPTASPTTTAAPTATAAPTMTGTWPTAAPTTTASAPPPEPPPLLPPLVGAEARKAEVRAILAELIATLPQADRDRVKSIPLVFDPDPKEINAFAGCNKGDPYMATTEGFMLAVDAIAQTRATDELFATKTYDAYATTVAARLAKGGDPSLPAGSIPKEHVSDPKRQSRAREIYGDVMAFALGHELAHHYLGHTGCANGQAAGTGPNPAVLGQLMTTVVPVLNQPIELAADNASTRNVITAGRARRPAFEWSERGGLMLFDFFGSLEANAPLLAKVAFLRTHPDSKLRKPFVEAAARSFRKDNPG